MKCFYKTSVFITGLMICGFYFWIYYYIKYHYYLYYYRGVFGCDAVREELGVRRETELWDDKGQVQECDAEATL